MVSSVDPGGRPALTPYVLVAFLVLVPFVLLYVAYHHALENSQRDPDPAAHSPDGMD